LYALQHGTEGLGGAELSEPQHWLLVRGRGERRLAPEVLAGELQAHSSTRRPAVEPGDQALLYAAGWQVVFGVVEVVGELDHDPAKQRWSWRFPIRPLVALDDLRKAPPVEAAGVLPRSLGRHSYVRLTAEQFEAGRRAIEEAV
jgi:EVE domain